MRHALAKSEPWVAGSTCGRLLVARASQSAWYESKSNHRSTEQSVQVLLALALVAIAKEVVAPLTTVAGRRRHHRASRRARTVGARLAERVHLLHPLPLALLSPPLRLLLPHHLIVVPHDRARRARGRLDVSERLARHRSPAVVLGAAVPSVVLHTGLEESLAPVVVHRNRRRLKVSRVISRRKGADVGDWRVRVHLVVDRGREELPAETEAHVNGGRRVDQRRLARIDAAEQLTRIALLAEEQHLTQVAKDAAVGEATPAALDEKGGAPL